MTGTTYRAALSYAKNVRKRPACWCRPRSLTRFWAPNRSDSFHVPILHLPARQTRNQLHVNDVGVWRRFNRTNNFKRASSVLLIPAHLSWRFGLVDFFPVFPWIRHRLPPLNHSLTCGLAMSVIFGEQPFASLRHLN